MRQEIPLSDAEVAALDAGISALNSSRSCLVNAPAPAGPTPRLWFPLTGESDLGLAKDTIDA
jgi:hypothetical protein